ncbi:MAG: hypothetical protein AMJ73_02115 [candidate division Zixibacteria bacterium SM1_73]|nr:MAG: hypothetical protein AMJ73_02115 [candidate division Zixibacteria bacterium SM1_73]
MRKIVISIFIFIFVLSSTGIVWSQQNEEDGKLQKIFEEYMDALWKFYPTAGTMAGFHRYDNKLGDFGEKNVEKRMEELDKFNQDLVTKVDRTKMSPEFQITHEMLMDALDSERLKFEQLIPWEYDPLFYNTIFINCVRPLLKNEFAPLDTRAKNATDRLKDLPKLIKQAKEILKNPTQISTETAIKQFPAIFEIFRTELPTLASQVPENQRTKLLSELGKVIPALEDYQNYLRNELLPKSAGNFRLGEAHVRFLRLTLQNNIPIQELVERARADVKNITEVEMAIVCLPLYRLMYPDVDMQQLTSQRGENEARRIIIKGVLDKIKEEHVSKDEFLDKIRSMTEEIKSFLNEKQLIDLPDMDLNIEPMPAEYQGITWTRFVTPGAYETSQNFTAQITPFPEDWNEQQITSFLEEYNNYLLYFYTIRTIYPGTFIPYFYANQNSSLLEKLYPSLPLIKGWSIPLEEKLIFEGFGNYDLRRRLNQLKFKLRIVTDFIAEFQIHEGNWTKEDAINYMMRVGFQTEAEAERKWNRILLLPGDAAYAYVGVQEILDMETEYKQLKGDSFSQKEFYKELLSHGALPLRHLKKKILEQ